MSLSCVELSLDLLEACFAHALTAEAEEVMGLLLGDVSEAAGAGPGGGESTARIWALSFQQRIDKRPDRVEVGPEQLAAATQAAEDHGQRTGKRTRVIGWYHSHPHITVLPSHVDVQTQGSFQMLDSGFVGLIFSCFCAGAAQHEKRLQASAFQAFAVGGGRFERRLVPLRFVATPRQGARLGELMPALTRVQLAEQQHAFEAAAERLRRLGAEAGGAHGPALESARLHHASLFAAAVTHHLGTTGAALVQATHDRLRASQKRVGSLERERDALLLNGEETSPQGAEQ